MVSVHLRRIRKPSSLGQLHVWECLIWIQTRLLNQGKDKRLRDVNNQSSEITKRSLHRGFIFATIWKLIFLFIRQIFSKGQFLDRRRKPTVGLGFRRWFKIYSTFFLKPTI